MEQRLKAEELVKNFIMEYGDILHNNNIASLDIDKYLAYFSNHNDVSLVGMYTPTKIEPTILKKYKKKIAYVKSYGRLDAICMIVVQIDRCNHFIFDPVVCVAGNNEIKIGMFGRLYSNSPLKNMKKFLKENKKYLIKHEIQNNVGFGSPR